MIFKAGVFYFKMDKSILCLVHTGKNNGFPFLDILGYLKKFTHKNPKFGKVRQVPTREFPTKFPDWDLSHSSKFGIFVGIISLNIPKYPKMGICYFSSAPAARKHFLGDI